MLTNKKAFPQKLSGYIYLGGKRVKIGSSKKIGENSKANTIKAIQELKKYSIFALPQQLDDE